MERIFKYYPSDFGKLIVKVLHMDLDFDIYDDYSRVKSVLKLQALEEISVLELDAKNLELHSIVCEGRQLSFVYDKDAFKIIIAFDKPVVSGEVFSIISDNSFRPTKNILEGMYFDETPEGAPPTMITQCQQWGFQRLVPCIDDMAAKCTYTTSITADSRYTSIISNGDVKESRKTIEPGRDRIVYDNTKTPMAPYLFFLGVGTYDTFNRVVEYPDGGGFTIELLVMKGALPSAAAKALDMIYDCALWVYLFTGQDMYRNEALSNRIRALIDERDSGRLKGIDVSATSDELGMLCNGVRFGYKYTGTVYREIAMQNSDYGGMENVGNTTITANRIMPYPDMTDPPFEYMFRVKVHEYYHNINGSEVTGWSPFEIWLNEAVTVHVERWYHAHLFGRNYSRLANVLGLLSPDGGTFALDSGVASMPIEPDGFNDTNELITSITYVKAPEFVRMIETLIGKENFALALHNYHTKFAHSNATWQQWLAEMQSASGLDLENMARTWLKKREYPVVEATAEFDDDSKIVKIRLSQVNASAQEPWSFPFKYALLDAQGNVLREGTAWVKEKICEIAVSVDMKPAVISLNRGYSFYGKLIFRQSREELTRQLRLDTDPACKYMAFYHLVDLEKRALLMDESRAVPVEFADVFYSLISDERLCSEYGSRMLVIFESVEDEEFGHQYTKLYEAKKKILQAIAKKYEVELKLTYSKYALPVVEDNYVKKSAVEIKRRQVKNACLAILASLDTQEIIGMLRQQFEKSGNSTDKIVSLGLYLNSSAKDKRMVLNAYQQAASQNLVRWESFLSVIGSTDAEDCIGLIRWAEELPSFRIEQANDQRALYCSFSANKKKSLETSEGREFLKDLIIKLTPINEHTVGHMLSDFGGVDKMHKDYRAGLAKLLVEVLQATDGKKYPSVYNTAKRTLYGLPKARAEYEEEYGKIPEL